ncbi:MAG: hypothetical protein ABIG39_05895 [Candidatus Micrarchaeota archaeon]
MEIAVEAVAVGGKRENWITISLKDNGGIDLQLTRGKNPIIQTNFRLVSAEFGSGRAQIEIKVFIKVIVQESRLGGVLGSSKLVGAEAEADFRVSMTGSRLEIENARLVWESGKTLPGKDAERVFRSVASVPVPDEMKEGVDEQALLLLGLLNDIEIKIT